MKVTELNKGKVSGYTHVVYIKDDKKCMMELKKFTKKYGKELIQEYWNSTYKD